MDITRIRTNNTNAGNFGRNIANILQLRFCKIYIISLLFLMINSTLKFQNVPLYSCLWLDGDWCIFLMQ